MSDGDRGLQAERTRLAWRRTTLAAAVVALLGFAHLLLGDAGATAQVWTALSALVWLAMLFVAHRRLKRLATPQPPPARRAPAALGLLAAAAALLGVLLIR